MTRYRRHHRRGRRRPTAELYARAARLGEAESASAPPSFEAHVGRSPDPDDDGRPLPFELSEDAAEPVIPDLPPTPPAAPAPPEPPSAELLYGAAREAAARGDVTRAIGIYRELITDEPTHLKARNNVAILLDEQGDHAAALRELDRCLQLAPGNAQVLVNRGAVLGSLARFAEAESDLREVLVEDPANAEAHFNLGIVMSRRGLWRDAIPHLRRAIELDASRAAAYFHLGEALNRTDDLDGALQAYQRSAELRPDNPRSLRGLGIVLDRLNRPTEAAQMYRRSRELATR